MVMTPSRGPGVGLGWRYEAATPCQAGPHGYTLSLTFQRCGRVSGVFTALSVVRHVIRTAGTPTIRGISVVASATPWGRRTRGLAWVAAGRTVPGGGVGQAGHRCRSGSVPASNG